jgi:hypothetical protein
MVRLLLNDLDENALAWQSIGDENGSPICQAPYSSPAKSHLGQG